MVDPYFNVNFFSWFYLFLRRVPLLLLGQYEQVYSDEIQVLVLGCFAVSASLLGVFLVLKRLTMMANALSHTMLLGIVCAFMVSFFLSNAMPSDWMILVFSLGVALCTSVAIHEITRLWHIQEDASNGIVFSAFFALGIMLLSVWSRDIHVGVELLMGNPDALHVQDIPFVVATALLTIVLCWMCTRGLTLSIFDPTFAQLIRFHPTLFIHILLLLVAVSVVSAFRAVGCIMTLTFFVVPALFARLFAHDIKKALVLSVAIGLGSVFVSVALARHVYTCYYLPVSTGALAAVLLGFSFLCVTFVRCMKSKSLS